MNDKFKKRKEIEENLISPNNLLKSQKILIGIIFLNIFLVIYFFIFLTIVFNPYVFIGISHNLFNYKLIGVFIFIFIMAIGFFEITIGIKLLRSRLYRTQILMVNTIGQVLLRKVLYSPSTEEHMDSNENTIKTLKILIPFMYMNFYLANFYFSLPYNHMPFILEIPFLLSIYIIVYIFHLCIGFIILLKANRIRYQFLKISSILQLLFYNVMIALSLFNPRSNLILILFSDTILFYITIRIIKNKDVLIQYLSLKNHVCHKNGSKMTKIMKMGPTCEEDLSKSKIDSEEVPIKKVNKKISTNKLIFEKEGIITKSSEPVEKSEGTDYLKNLTFLKDEKDQKLLQQYLLEKFVVVSEQLRKSINKLTLSKEEKIELLKDLIFLTRKEQQNLLELLVNLYND
jgi:hypothetical protein